MSTMQQYLEGRIDFEGQKTVERLTREALIGGTAVAFLAGLAAQSLRVTFGVLGAAVVVLASTVVPPWPMYNSHPVKWLPAKKDRKQE